MSGLDLGQRTVEAADPGEHQVQQDEVESGLSCEFQAHFAGRRQHDLEALLAQAQAHEVGEIEIVFDEEDGRSHAGP